MSKTAEAARSFLKKSSEAEPFKEGFELQSPAKIQNIGIAITAKLTPEEERAIQKIFVDDYLPERLLESEVETHVQKVTDITRQIKSINAQSVLLHGERISQVQEILKDYRTGAFTKWLLATYGNRQTPYSMLRFYEFYQQAPIAYKPVIDAAPKKAIYVLASREGSFEKKLEILKNHGKDSQQNLLLLIEDTFPLQKTDKRKAANTVILDAIKLSIAKLEKRKEHFTRNDRDGVVELIERLQSLLKK